MRHLSTWRAGSAVRAALALALALACGPTLAITPASAATDPIARSAIDTGDGAWARRAEGASGETAAAGPIAAAVAAYEEALSASPQSLEAMWKLEQALYFQAQFTAMPAAERERVWDRGVELADRSIAILHPDETDWQERSPEALAATVTDRGLGAAVHFWAAIHWGSWGETKGSLAAVRKGVAKRIRDHALVAIALDETLEDGGPHRLLGRLHTVAPRVPLFTGWVSHDDALRELERAVEIAPANPANRLYLAEARLLVQPERRDEALREIEAVTTSAPRAESLLEDRRTQSEARAALDRASRPLR